MTVRLVYRSYGGENFKERPYYYTKMLTLTSFVRAAQQVTDAEVIFLNDGPVPLGRLSIMKQHGRVVSLGDQAQGMRASYRAALDLAMTETWADDDVVAYVEDDYLFEADAFVALAEAADDLPQASYFSLYGDRPDHADEVDRVEHSLPRGWQPAPDLVSGGRVWFNRISITSTFSARVGVLRRDMDIFIACMGPFRKRFFDHETCLIYQGVVPYHGAELFTGLPGDFILSPRGVARAIVLVPFRLRLNRLARAQRTAHLLYTLTPNLATHVEHPVISTDRDWVLVAAEVAHWADDHGLTESATTIRQTLTEAA